MEKLLLNTEIQEYINSNLNTDITSLVLKGSPFPSIDQKEIIEQIEAKKRCEKKLPTWFNTPNIYYPNKLNIEQTSSEITAKYKSSIISGNSIIDLTGGFGVDCYYFSKSFNKVTHCELNSKLSKIVKHNYKQLDINNIITENVNGIDFLNQTETTFDWIFIDPSRRHETKGKVVFLKDCLPNVPDNIDLLFKKSKNILIKTSPLLDISIGIEELKHVKYIHVVAVNNEVKELLWILEKDCVSKVKIVTINLKKDTPEAFNFTLEKEKNIESIYSKPLTYLYESNAAILKSGAFNSISNQLKLFKLHKHSHLYTSDTLIDFPGRRFKIEKQLEYNKKAFKGINISKANITTRNFPDSVDNIRKKLKIKDGGNSYLFFTTNLNDYKIVLLCSKIL